MKLYHYSSNLYNVLLSRKAATGAFRQAPGTTLPGDVLTEAKYRDSLEKAKKFSLPGSYYDHISFFFDPIPSAMIGKLFENNHHTWFNGNKLFEHVIDTRDIPKGFIYDVVETPAAQEQLNATEWVDTDEFFAAFMKERKVIKQALGELGRGQVELDRQIKRFQGSTEKFYRLAKNLPDWELHRTKYAANVPHVMIYADNGRIPVREINQLIIGSDRRDPVNVNVEQLLSLKW